MLSQNALELPALSEFLFINYPVVPALLPGFAFVVAFLYLERAKALLQGGVVFGLLLFDLVILPLEELLPVSGLVKGKEDHLIFPLWSFLEPLEAQFDHLSLDSLPGLFVLSDHQYPHVPIGQLSSLCEGLKKSKGQSTISKAVLEVDLSTGRWAGKGTGTYDPQRVNNMKKELTLRKRSFC